MTYHKITRTLALAACLLLPATASANRSGRLALNGRVVLASAATKIPPRFTVRLYHPKGSSRPTLVTYTNTLGSFRFANIDAGRYLLEIYRGEVMVYQKALTFDEKLPQPLVITLKTSG